MGGVAFQALGCRVNRADLDAVAEELVAAGIPVVDKNEASVIVINTCSVTNEADSKGRQFVRRALALPQEPWVVVSGCSARLFANMYTDLSDRVVIVEENESIAEKVLELVGSGFECSGDVASYLTPTGRTRPLVKIQDGCDLRCTYCIVWKARGASRSVAPEDVIQKVNEAVARGAGEVVLTGINIGCYSADTCQGELRLPGLLDMLLESTNVGRLRISSIEPQDVNEDLIDVMAESKGRVAPYLHMCLQSGSNDVLKAMGRVYTVEDYAERVRMAKDRIENMTISTDIIAGFPTEKRADFLRTCEVCSALELAWLHVFRYSARPGTPAGEMLQQYPAEAIMRSQYLRELSDQLRVAEAKRCVGRVERVLAQGKHPGVSGGLLDVFLEGEAKEGQLVDALVTRARADGKLVAQII